METIAQIIPKIIILLVIVIVIYEIYRSQKKKREKFLELENKTYWEGRLPKEMADDMLREIKSNPQACSLDEIPQGIGKFGIEASNPIPIFGIPYNDVYLKRLALKDKVGIGWRRVGSMEVSNIVKSVDKYEIFNMNGETICNLHLSPYHWKISEKCPQGFKFKMPNEPAVGLKGNKQDIRSKGLSKSTKNVLRNLQVLMDKRFPKGDKDINAATNELLYILNNTISQDEAQEIVRLSIGISRISEDFTKERLRQHLAGYCLHHFTDSQVEEFHRYLNVLTDAMIIHGRTPSEVRREGDLYIW